MPRRLHILMAILSCCFLYLAPGCGSENQSADPQDLENSDKQDNSHENKAADQAPIPPVGGPSPILPPGVGVVGPGSGGGGGSQGSVDKHERTGNDDNDVRPPNEANTEAFGPLSCANGLDDDGNGLIDCLDPACNGQTCNDANGCTIGDVCQPSGDTRICVGTPVNCDAIIGEECALTSCEATSALPGDTNFICNAVLDPALTVPGSCTPDGNCINPAPDGSCPTNACISGTCSTSGGACSVAADCPPNNNDLCEVGACALQGGDLLNPPTFVCTATDKVQVPVAQGGCNDDNSCTGDECIPATGLCDFDALSGNPCGLDDDNPCTTGTCDQGTCNTTPRGTCTLGDVNACEPGFVCALVPLLSATPICTCDDENSCTGPVDGCIGAGVCSGTPIIGPAPCDDGNSCTSGEICSGDQCLPGPITSPASCTAPLGLNPVQCPVAPSTCVNVVMGTCSPASTNAGLPCDEVTDCPAGTCDGFQNQCACTDTNACATSTCTGSPVTCQPTVFDDTICAVDDNLCTEQECTATGCVTAVLSGVQACVVIDTTPTPDVCVQGSVTCTLGVAGGPCVANDPAVVVPCP